jgi:MYXO-CTERM domain-containing protein
MNQIPEGPMMALLFLAALALVLRRSSRRKK